MRTRRQWFGAILLAGAALPAPFAHASESEPVGARDILVRGEPLPPQAGALAYDSVLLGRDALSRSASGGIESVLGSVAGFQQFRRADSRSANPSAQGATVRALGGNASSRTLVLLDGVPMADPFFGYIPFNALVPDRLSFVRVTRGAGNGPFGAGAVAGTIEMASANRAGLPSLSLDGMRGSYRSTQLSAGATQDVGRGFLTVSGQWSKSAGFYTTPGYQRTIATVPARNTGWSASGRLVLPVSDSAEVQARILAFKDNRTLRFAGANSMSKGQDASLRLVSHGPWQVDALAYVQRRNFSNVVISATTFRRSLDQRDTPSSGIGGKIELRPPIGGGHELSIGGDVRRASGHMAEDGYNAATGLITSRRFAGGKQSTAGAFIEDAWALGALTLTGGARIDHWRISDGAFATTTAGGSPTAYSAFPDRSGTRLTGRIGARVTLASRLKLRAAAYTGFRLPTLNELYRPFSLFPVTTQANAQLRPEKVRGAEFGIDWSATDTLNLSATAFNNRLADAIANVTTGVNLRQRQNVRAITARGLELEASWRRHAWRIDASWAWSHARVDAPGLAFHALRPAQSPKHSANLSLGWERAGGPMVSANLHYTSRQYEDDLQTDSLRPGFTLDAVAKLPLNSALSLSLRGENLLNARIITRNAGGSIDYGIPRILWIGLKYTR